VKRIGLLAFLIAATVSAQPATRRATNVAALLVHSTFYHLRQVTLVGKISLQNNGEMRVTSDAGSIRLIYRGSVPDGPAEVRGEFWDVGRMGATDPRLANLDLKATFGIDPDASWPRPGQVLAIVGSSVSAATPPAAPSIRNVVLYPERYLDQRITLTGQFAGRNLLGDLPDAPGQSRYDFVLRSADAAVWITNMRPRGKDFELALDARIDTGRWLEVSGTLHEGRGLQWLDAQAGSLKLTQAPKDVPEEQPIRVQAAPPPEVVFSTPTEGETEVASATRIRIQFSRDINPTSFRNHIRIGYSPGGQRPLSEPPPPAPEFSTQYMPGTRVLEIRFTGPFERFQTIRVELMEGIVGTDNQPLKPWTLTFQTGGS
jgi:Big-like domain-containing protein